MPENKDRGRLAARRAALAKCADWMRGYVKSYYSEDEEIQSAIRLKEAHTARVVEAADALAKHLALSEEDAVLASLMGLLHDVGRFRQFTVYRTFNDAQSEDHAALGLSVVAREGLLDGLEAEEQALIRFAIARHNQKTVGAAPDARFLGFAKLLRDADKLDIYRVLEPFLAPSDGSGVSPDFIGRFARGEQCDYTQIRTMDDRKLVRLMWVYDVNFAWTLRRIVERGYIDKIVRCLPEDARLEEGVARLRAYAAQKCASADVGFYTNHG